LVVFKATNNQINNRTGTMKLLILLSFFLLSIFHGVNGGRSENDLILANDYKITFSNYNSESLPVEMSIYVNDVVVSTQDITIPAAELFLKSNIEGLDQIPGEYDLEQAIPITSSQNFNIHVVIIDEPIYSEKNWKLSYTVDINNGGTWRQVFNSARRKFISGRFCPELDPCHAHISNLGNGEWNTQGLNIYYSNSNLTPLITDYRGGNISITIDSFSDLLFDYTFPGPNKNLKSALDDALVGFEITGEHGNFRSYRSAYPSVALIANPFKAPTGGLTSPITAEQVTEFAISIASPTYGIIEND
jgi:hypothetical protein